jgi:hypothetical protein
MFLCFPQELVQKLEGFKHISWKKDQGTDDVHNFTFSIQELSSQSLCLDGAVKTETCKKPSANHILPEPAVDCTAKNGSCPTIMPTATSIENEISENESEVGDTEQHGDVCSDGMLDSTTNRVSVSTNGINASSESMNAVTESHTNSCVMLDAADITDLIPPACQTSLPGNTEVSEMQTVKDEPAEYCGALNEMNLPVGHMQSTATQCSLMPLEVGCSAVVHNDNTTQGSQLNDTYLLPGTSPSNIHIKMPGRLAQKRSVQQKVQTTGNKDYRHGTFNGCNFTIM